MSKIFVFVLKLFAKVSKQLKFDWIFLNYFFLACNCNEEGSVDQNCNAHGKCTCKENVIGDKCDTVVEAFYDITDPKGKLLRGTICISL